MIAADLRLHADFGRSPAFTFNLVGEKLLGAFGSITFTVRRNDGIASGRMTDATEQLDCIFRGKWRAVKNAHLRVDLFGNIDAGTPRRIVDDQIVFSACLLADAGLPDALSIR